LRFPNALKMKLSFIVPALNEEKFIERVIRQFDVLNGQFEFEVIIADGGSTDRTREIAQAFEAKVVIEDQVQNIAAGRNAGAKAASGDLLIFCDADTLIENVNLFAYRVVALFKDKNVIAAIPQLKIFPEERIWKDKLYHTFFNSFLRFSFFIKSPFSFGQCQVVRASAFDQVGGYDEDRTHAEDSFLIKKLNKIGTLKFLSDCTILESPRRYRKIGYLNSIRIGIVSAAMQILFKKNYVQKWERTD